MHNPVYCVKCRAKRPAKNLKLMKGERPRVSGVCSACGSKVSQFVSKKDLQKGGNFVDLINLTMPWTLPLTKSLKLN